MRLYLLCCVIALVAVATACVEDEVPLSKRTWVTAQPIANLTVYPGKPAQVQMKFRVADGYHINSNKPGSELLIPTAL
ncbi:MAG: hypothetical protein JO187_00875, partial [Acidobacteria bacterium]|nr:hypothetical protein [Acidobacteriota bacterium]